MSAFAKITTVAVALALACGMLPASSCFGGLAAVISVYTLIIFNAVYSWRSKLFGTALTQLSQAGERQVALSFDDGPDPESTPALLDLLAKRGAKASFFVIGKQVRSHPEIVARCHREGHSVGNHSDAHGLWTNFMFHTAMLKDLSACQAAIHAACGLRSKLYRPPFGLRNHAVAGVCKQLDLQLVGWNVHSIDKPHRSSAAILKRVLRDVKDGSIVLLHDGGIAGEDLLHVVSKILDELEQRGLKAVALEPRAD